MKVVTTVEEVNGEEVTTLIIREGKLQAIRTHGDEIISIKVSGVIEGRLKLDLTEKEIREIQEKAEKYDAMMAIMKNK
jgi:ABC-type phosphate/phosphonate transport system ATPase subunit